MSLSKASFWQRIMHLGVPGSKNQLNLLELVYLENVASSSAPPKECCAFEIVCVTPPVPAPWVRDTVHLCTCNSSSVHQSNFYCCRRELFYLDPFNFCVVSSFSPETHHSRVWRRNHSAMSTFKQKKESDRRGVEQI